LSKKRAIIIRTCLLDTDTRVAKEIDVLRASGYDVTLLGWDRQGNTAPPEPGENPHREIRLRLKAPLGVKILPFLPIWWCFEFFQLMVTRWDIAHAVDFDTLLPAVITGRLKGKPVIYEMQDTYEDKIVLPKPVRYLAVQIDKLFLRLASAVVVIDKEQIEELAGIPHHHVVAVYDSPPDAPGNIDIITEKNQAFTLFYDGGLYKSRRLRLENILAAVKSLEDVRIFITGYGDLSDEIEAWCRQMPDRAQFLGRVSYDEVLRRSLAADLLFAIRNPVIPEQRYICGSKLLKAMMCGKPVLASKGTSAASKVTEENCGLLVDADSVEEIRNAIIKLKDNPGLCRELGANARKAYEQRYDWHIMEQRLINLYQGLGSETGPGTQQ